MWKKKRKNIKAKERSNLIFLALLVMQCSSRDKLCCLDDPNSPRKWYYLARYHFGKCLYMARFYGT